MLPEAFLQGGGGGSSIAATNLWLLWKQARAVLIAPLLRVMVWVCLVMSVMILVEKVYLGVFCAFLKLFMRKPEKQYKWEPMKKKDDLEVGGNLEYPMVLVQIPMRNEKEVIYLALHFFILH